MKWVEACFSISWAALASSVLLIIWGVLYKPWKKGQLLDAWMLIALGLIDWGYAAHGYIEVSEIQDTIAPRHLTRARFLRISTTLMRFDHPPDPVRVVIDIDGTDREVDEQKHFGHEIEATFKAAGL